MPVLPVNPRTAAAGRAHAVTDRPLQRWRVHPLALSLLSVFAGACGPSPEEAALYEAGAGASTARQAATMLLWEWEQAAQACEEPSAERVGEILQGWGGIEVLESLDDKPLTVDDPEAIPVFLLDGNQWVYAHPEHGDYRGRVTSLGGEDSARPRSARVGPHSHLCKAPSASALEALKVTLDAPTPAHTVEGWRARESELREGIDALGSPAEGEPALTTSRFAVLMTRRSTRSLADYDEIDESGRAIDMGMPATSLSAYTCALRLVWLASNGDILGVASGTSDEHEPDTPKSIDLASVDRASRLAQAAARTEAAVRLAASLDG